MARQLLLFLTLSLILVTTTTLWMTRGPLMGEGMMSQESASGKADIGGKFALTDQNGKRFTDADLKGKLSLVFFGFTHCPDICPTTLSLLEQVTKALGPEAKEIAVVFISVDPERDTPERLKEYLKGFDLPVTGLTGSKEEAAAAAKAYKAYYARAENTTADKVEDYLVNHSGYIYLMDRDGEYLTHFSQGSKVEDVVNELKKHL